MKNKVTIIGAGMVGSTIAYSLISHDTTEEIAMIDLNEKLLEAQVMDLQHSVPFCSSTYVHAGTYADCGDSSVVIVSCGAAQKPGETRLDLVKNNTSIIKKVVPEVFAQNPDAILIMVTNPVDVLTYVSAQMFPEKKRQIIGTGTLLDSARLRHLLGQKLGIGAKSIHAYVIGEHGDSELPLWSTAAIGNMKLSDHPELSDGEKDRIFHEAKNSAYTIIEGKQATYYAIGAGVVQLVSAIVHNEKNVLPVSFFQDGTHHNVTNVCLSMPAVIGRGGVCEQLHLDITEREQELLENSARILKETIDSVS